MFLHDHKNQTIIIQRLSYFNFRINIEKNSVDGPTCQSFVEPIQEHDLFKAVL